MQIRILLLVASVFAMTNFYLIYSKKILENKNIAYERQFEAIKLSSDLEVKKAELAKEKAEKDLKISQAEASRVLEIDVPIECQKAIEWAIEQAKKNRS